MTSRSRIDLWKKLARETAKTLGERRDYEIVKHIVSLKMLAENLRVRILGGEVVDPVIVLRLDEALRRYLPAGKPLSVQIEVVGGSNPTPDTPSPTPPTPTPPDSPPDPAKPTIDAEPVSAAATPSPSPSNVVPIPIRTTADELHFQASTAVLPSGERPPLKRFQGNAPGGYVW
jgi:hypothetical protein